MLASSTDTDGPWQDFFRRSHTVIDLPAPLDASRTSLGLDSASSGENETAQPRLLNDVREYFGPGVITAL